MFIQIIKICYGTSCSQQNTQIVIKPADKGSATVILSRGNYIREAHRQLNNPKYYKKLDKAIWSENCKTFNAIIYCLKDQGHINDKQVKYQAARSKSQTRTFYLLPKIHKPVKYGQIVIHHLTVL